MNLRSFLKMTHSKFSKPGRAFSWAMVFMLGVVAAGVNAQVLIEDDFETVNTITLDPGTRTGSEDDGEQECRGNRNDFLH